jgi:hypothetical protein
MQVIRRGINVYPPVGQLAAAAEALASSAILLSAAAFSMSASVAMTKRKAART